MTTTAVPAAASIETTRSWIVAGAALAILTVSYGSPYVSVIALQEIAASFDDQRAIPALASSLVWLGSGAGGIFMGPLAERIGVRAAVAFGGLMIAAGFAVSVLHGSTALLIGHGLMVGLLGTGAIHAPLFIYVSRWFDRRRGTALALIASGQYLGGAFWPTLMQYVTTMSSWRWTMVVFGALSFATIVPIAAIFLKPPPREQDSAASTGGVAAPTQPMGLSPTTRFALLSLAAFLCCVPMAMPQGHLPAMCGDLGITPARGALMLSVLLGLAFFSRQFWGWLSDRIGGLATVAAGSFCQMLAMIGFLFTQNEVGMFIVAGGFGLGFSGIVPAYMLSVRELFPATEASWRIPGVFFCSLIGMFVGGWVAGIIYDHTASYALAFELGILSNLANLAVLLFMMAKLTRRHPPVPALAH